MITLDKERIFKMALAFMKVTKKPDEFLTESLELGYEELLKAADFRHIFALSDDDKSILPGKSVQKHMANHTQFYYFAATLGQSVDVLIKKTQLSSMSRAVVIDALAGAMLDDYCDKVCGEAMPDTATKRFSPGYGDMPLSFQDTLLAKCRGEKLGIKVLPSKLLIPSKSITAVIGV
ncbi:MAG: hypothetical protein IJT38_05390 [Clostridia bacterium]|nr:hypothetical protein [Clostridia bacterium]